MFNIYNIHISDEIALLGVDNDMLICNFTDLPISSIVLDIERVGYEIRFLMIIRIFKKIKGCTPQ